MSARIPVGPALWTEVDPIAQLIAVTFRESPPDRWLVPDSADRRAVMPGYFRILVEEAMAAGSVQTSVDGHAVAVWMYATGSGTGPGRDHDEKVAAATGAYLDRFRAFEEMLAVAHPTQPHHHLALLAVRPGHQRQGYGSALLAQHHATLDHDGLPAYLEAVTAGVQHFYRRFGYRQLETSIQVPGGGPTLYPMWRSPSPRPRLSG